MAACQLAGRRPLCFTAEPPDRPTIGQRSKGINLLEHTVTTGVFTVVRRPTWPTHCIGLSRYIAITNLSIIAVFVEYLRQFLIDLHQIYRHSSVPHNTSVRIFPAF